MVTIGPKELRRTRKQVSALEYATCDGSTDDRTALQSAADYAAANAITLVIPPGTYRISNYVRFLCAVEADPDALFLVDSTAGAVGIRIGTTGTRVSSKRLLLPRVQIASKLWTTAPSIGTDRGVVVENARACTIALPYVGQFSVGLDLNPTGTEDVTYNTFLPGYLDRNAINGRFKPEDAGYANQNTFIGGRWGNGGDGTNLVGFRQIQMLGVGATYFPDNNTFVGCSLEGDNPEYIIEMAGAFNEFINCRWEIVSATPRIWLRASGSAGKPTNRNRFAGGFGLNQVEFTEEAGTGSQVYTILDMPDGERRQYRGSSGGMVLQNASSSDDPILTLMPASNTAMTDTIGGYLSQLTAQFSRYKAAADTQARLVLAHLTGRIYFGPGGSTAPTSFIGHNGGDNVLFNAFNTTFAPDNTHDIGVTSARPRDVRAGRDVVAGRKVLTTDGLGVGNSAAATTLGTVVKKVQVFDASGASLGYVPIYDAIT